MHSAHEHIELTYHKDDQLALRTIVFIGEQNKRENKTQLTTTPDELSTATILGFAWLRCSERS